MFERFTERARQVVVFAQDEARSLKHNYIGTEHLLLGLLREREGPASRVLESLGVTLEAVRERVKHIVGVGDEVESGMIPFTPRAKKVLELSLREALSLGHNYIGTEHVFLGLVREGKGVASQILLGFGADSEKIQHAVIGALAGPQAFDPAVEPGPTPWTASAQAVDLPGTARRRGRREQRRTWQVEALLVGWAMFGLAAGLGLLLGWLIWA